MPFLALIGAKLWMLLRRSDFIFAVIILISLLGSLQLSATTGDWSILIKDASGKIFSADDRIYENVLELTGEVPVENTFYSFLDIWGNLLILFFIIKFFHWVVERLVIETGNIGSWAIAFMMVGLIEMVYLVAVNTSAGIFNFASGAGWMTIIPYRGMISVILHPWILLPPQMRNLWEAPVIREYVNVTPNIMEVLPNTTAANPVGNLVDVIYVPPA